MKDFISLSIDRIELFDEPYFYGLCDNFLPNNLIEELLLISNDNPRREVGLHRNWPVPKIGKSSNYKKNVSILNQYITCWEDPIIMESAFNKFGVKLTDFQSKYEVKDFDDLRVVHSLRKFAPGFNYKPHNDTPSKGISIVVFVYPMNQKGLKHHLGTILYKFENKPIGIDKNGKEIKYSYFGSVEWEVNRAFIISAISQKSKEKKTLHSYHVPEYITQGRVTLMINIIPKNAVNP